MSGIRYSPRQDYILVRPLARRQSCVLEVVSHEKFCRGEIVAVGPGKRDAKGRTWPLDSKVGDAIIFGDGRLDIWPKYEEDGVRYLILQEADIAAIIESEEADFA